jgi:hypothetical protein
MMTVTLLAAVGSMLVGPGPDAGALDAARGFRDYSGTDAAKLWKGYKQEALPAQGWTTAGGEFKHGPGGGGGDIVTRDEFADFDLLFEFKTAPKANSGVMYRVGETLPDTWNTGPEYQVIDDAGNGLKPEDPHSTGAMYELYAPPATKVLKPAGEWNSGRIVVRNGVVQHWLNGAKIVDARIFDDQTGRPTPEWKERIAGTKFKPYEGFGVLPKGRIALQDHGDEVAYRNIRIRDLSGPMPAEKRLYNGKDLAGWTAIVPDLVKDKKDQASVWHVEPDGVLVCAGNPVGYIRTTDKYTNYILRVEWRFNPVTKKAGNSGVLLRMVGEDKVWPKSVEAQLESGNAGDFWNIDNVKMTTDPARTSGRNTKKTHGAERPVGEWNEYEIVVNHGDVVLYVNGEELNRASGVEEVPGYICLQSEGAEIQFRSVRLTPLP